MHVKIGPTTVKSSTRPRLYAPSFSRSGRPRVNSGRFLTASPPAEKATLANIRPGRPTPAMGGGLMPPPLLLVQSSRSSRFWRVQSARASQSPSYRLRSFVLELRSVPHRLLPIFGRWFRWKRLAGHWNKGASFLVGRCYPRAIYSTRARKFKRDTTRAERGKG
jgi:hypothetical protein